ncbi:type II toxin-antitoxin system PemK/MazF family toxin [Bacteroidota bacterium]
MERFVKGDVVVIPFPFSDLTETKRRPALILTALDGSDVILCQITSRNVKDGYAIQISDDDFESGTLKQISNVRPNRIFTADGQIVLYKIGKLQTAKISHIVNKVVEIISY